MSIKGTSAFSSSVKVTRDVSLRKKNLALNNFEV